MSAEYYTGGILILPVVDWLTGKAEQEVMGNGTFHIDQDDDIRTLSTTGTNSGAVLQGVLYVPTLSISDPCYNETAQYIPQNVTGKQNRLEDRYPLMAVAPWTSANCTLSYLEAAREEHDLEAFIFYQPDVDTNVIPPSSDDTWDLGDGGAWKRTNEYPVYVIASSVGAQVLDAISTQTGNISEVAAVSEAYPGLDPDKYWIASSIKIITNGSGPVLPSLWIFLVIVLATLLGVIVLTSVGMHLLLRRQRRSLQRRVANGEVDLELLGVKRMNVPLDVLKKMPTTLYTANELSHSNSTTTAAAKGTSVDPEQDAVNGTAAATTANVAGNMAATGTSTLDQPTCSICLDDFISGESVVRQLPCRHIFHPECVDTFLLEHSSLCPVCKACVLPPGFVPHTVTNAMVRRERVIRRSRARQAASERLAAERAVQAQNTDGDSAGAQQAGNRLSRIALAGRRASTAILEMNQYSRRPTTTPATTADPQPANSESQPRQQLDPESRRALARRRASAILGQVRMPEDEDAEREARMPRWRRVITTAFPGFR